jgi:hypothetical protein
MSLHDEKPYKPKIRGRRVYGRDELSFRSLRGALSARPRRAARARVATTSLGHLGRRVIVKAWYVRVGPTDSQRSAKMFLRYMEKEGAAPDGGHSVLYGAESSSPRTTEVQKERDSEWRVDPGPTSQPTAEGLSSEAASERAPHDGSAEQENADADDLQAAPPATTLEHEILQPIAGEKHQFRIVVSPDDGDRLDLTRFTKELMEQVERDVGQPLIWAAANHYDTDDPHVHIVIRGVDRNGKQVRFDRAYISRIWRERAQELVTRELGPRTELEYKKQLEREVRQARLTSLDRVLGKRAVNGVVLLRELTKPQRERLKFLGEMGLARELNARAWQLGDGWQRRLREDGERGDIIKRMHSALRMDTSRYRIVNRFDALPGAPEEGRAITGRVAALGLLDTWAGGMYAIVESSRGDAYYVPLWKSETTDLRQGQLVTLSEQKRSWQKPLDELLEALVSKSGGVLSTADVAAAIERRLEFHRLAGDAQQEPDARWAVRNGFRETARAETVYDRTLDSLIARDAGDSGAVVPTRIVDRLSQRIEELATLGIAESSRGGRRLQHGFREQLAQRDRSQPRVRVDLRRHPQSLEQSVTYLGPTWLDHAKPRGLRGFAAEVVAALPRRQSFLREHRLTERDLERRERESVAVMYAQRLSRRAPIRADGFSGTVEAIYEAASGNKYALIVNAESVLAIRAGIQARRLIGQKVLVSMRSSEYDSRPKLHMSVVRGRER